ncbi:conjugal transfer protein TraQ, partial [Klebsiella pneumoniae]|uniref:conjugal transfer protein TraQ n=1 Tax=Klebsiella pneumoniae TaxID=573 RepID=UPI001C5F2C90
MSGSKDAIQMLVHFAQGLLGAFVHLMFTLGATFAVVGAITYLAHQANTRKAPAQTQGSGKVVAWLLLCGGLAGLDQMIGAGARQLGWQGATFDAISYVDVGTFGVAADAA